MNAGFSDNRNFSSPDNGLTPAILLRNGVPTPPQAELGPGFGAGPVGSSVILSPDYIDRDHQNLYAHHFNVSIQKQLTGTTLLEFEYLCNMTHRAAGGCPVNINDMPP